MLGIEIYPGFTFRSNDELAAALRDIADRVARGEIGNDGDEDLWSMVGSEERPEDGPGMWVLKCHAHGHALYVGQGHPEADTSPVHQVARRHAYACAGLTAAACKRAATA